MSEHYSIDKVSVEAIAEKTAAMTRWLEANAPDCEKDQRHLDEGTIERVYWHFGYVCATRDFLAMLTPPSSE
jgi:hypothetical protein